MKQALGGVVVQTLGAIHDSLDMPADEGANVKAETLASEHPRLFLFAHVIEYKGLKTRRFWEKIIKTSKMEE